MGGLRKFRPRCVVLGLEEQEGGIGQRRRGGGPGQGMDTEAWTEVWETMEHPGQTSLWEPAKVWGGEAT